MIQGKDTGRPALAYGRKCKPTEVGHEVMVAEIEVLTGIRIERSKKRGRTEPDGTGIKDGVAFALEVDYSGKMTRKQMQAKATRYKGTTGFVLFVAMDESRMRRLMEWLDAIKELCLFSTFDRLRHVAEPWVDWRGGKVAI